MSINIPLKKKEGLMPAPIYIYINFVVASSSAPFMEQPTISSNGP
jgi:hypothetical protein